MARATGFNDCETAAIPGGRGGGDDERAAIVALMRTTPKRADWSKLTERLLEVGSARQLWESDHPAGLFEDSDATALLAAAGEDVSAWKNGPFVLHTLWDASYPAQLRSVRQMPPVVFTQGRVASDEMGISVVGSRQASEAGLAFAREVTRRLIVEGFSVIAGLAEGIDTVAHRHALEAGGRTVAVLGNGLGHVYPRSNRDLQQQIADEGMLLTHYLPEYVPTRWSFLARNTIMSAYSLASVIVEANEHSGTRTQAREALAHGRPVVISEQVATTTEWGAALAGEPAVSIAATPDDVIRQVATIMKRQRLMEAWLESLATYLPASSRS